ncbi:DUF2631 domain-containing protein [Streptomonospora nanhaiensis]|uniref:DUF2631 domain-containing protein n=1 Tax=Amycolatopsis magusensis TaxID=882444 RepID=A0ABS4Q400_9PSEU|nr:DUF2631 domain-containing protein [Amycolatopsis magusensis]MBP2186400.1 hypothetical protein [Amycolatopsis magusensis]MDI5975983.1 DUF2631 domain-containing protein [Amycolatopsis magusensis]
MASKAVEKRSNQVDPRDEPSAEWGWHGTFPKATRFAGWLSVAALLVMLIGNHQNAMEDIWLVGLAIGLAFALILDLRKRRTAWRR